MPYAIKDDGQLRSVSLDMALEVDETLVDVLPDWLLSKLEEMGAVASSNAREASWRADELAVTARQLEALEEAEADVPPVDLLAGTRQQWLKYRGRLSNWKDGALYYPDPVSRPARPA